MRVEHPGKTKRDVPLRRLFFYFWNDLPNEFLTGNLFIIDYRYNVNTFTLWSCNASFLDVTEGF